VNSIFSAKWKLRGYFCNKHDEAIVIDMAVAKRSFRDVEIGNVLT